MVNSTIVTIYAEAMLSTACHSCGCGVKPAAASINYISLQQVDGSVRVDPEVGLFHIAATNLPEVLNLDSGSKLVCFKITMT